MSGVGGDVEGRRPRRCGAAGSAWLSTVRTTVAQPDAPSVCARPTRSLASAARSSSLSRIPRDPADEVTAFAHANPRRQALHHSAAHGCDRSSAQRVRVDSYVPALYPHRGPPPVVLPAGTERRDPSPYGYRTMIEDRFHHGQVRGPHRRDPKPRIPRDEAAKFRSSQSRLRQRGISQSEPDSSPRRRPEGCFACLRHGLSHNSPHAPLAMRSQGLLSVTEQDQGPRPT